jgi:hypothetical protein
VIRNLVRLLALLVVVASPLRLAAQTTPTPEQEAEIQAWFLEMENLSEQINPIQTAARQHPEIHTKEVALSEALSLAIRVIDPTMDERMARVRQLETQADSARTAGNQEQLQGIISEALEIRQHFMTIQQSAMEEPAMAEKFAVFQAELERKMVELHPEAQPMIARYHELDGLLQTAFARMSGAPQ